VITSSLRRSIRSTLSRDVREVLTVLPDDVELRRLEHTFDTERVRVELESMRRSAAIGNGLTPTDQQALLDMCDRLLAEREEIRRVLDDLGPAWTDARVALNRLARLVGPLQLHDVPSPSAPGTPRDQPPSAVTGRS
jgi:hypothetical protein